MSMIYMKQKEDFQTFFNHETTTTLAAMKSTISFYISKSCQKRKEINDIYYDSASQRFSA